MRTLLAIALLLSVTACSTVWGVGKDISDAATWTHDKMTTPSKTEPAKQDPAR
jgi:predicted small secreted protein